MCQPGEKCPGFAIAITIREAHIAPRDTSRRSFGLSSSTSRPGASWPWDHVQKPAHKSSVDDEALLN